ncbi:MAG: protein translocase subunit SecF, partial [Acidimicrobiales bacterium]
MSERSPHVWSRLYRGETAFDFIGRKRVWFLISCLVIAVGFISLGVQGLNFGIDFRGGTAWQVQTPGVTVAQTKGALAPLGLGGATVETLGTGTRRTLEVQYRLSGPISAQNHVSNQVTDKLAGLAHVNPSAVSITNVGPTWGSSITTKALEALIVFFIAIGAYIAIRFEWKMAVSAILAVFHDLAVTVGIYSLSGLQVTPSTVVAVLTILGYSLYDTIVVFDRVMENAKGLTAQGKLTYSGTVNLSMNQVLMRSINTSMAAILPILSVLIIGAQVLGATTLEDFGLALFIGLTSGAYSSIFIASPLLALFKEREPRYKRLRERLVARGEANLLLTPAAVAGSRGLTVGTPRGGAARGTAAGRQRSGSASGGGGVGTLEPGSAGRAVPTQGGPGAGGPGAGGPGADGPGAGGPG